MRVIVTGASGFLGHALMKALSGTGVEVIGLTRRHHPGLVHVVSYREAPEGDVLVHLAEANDRAWANAQGAPYEAEAAETMRALLGKKYGYCIYASSAALYGDACHWPRRVDEVVVPIDSYTRIKYASEQAILAAGGAAVRLTNLYGPGMSPNNVVSTILKQLPQGGPLSLHATSPVRDFLWIDDAASAISSMIRQPSSGLFNVGTSVGTSIQALAEKALAIVGQAGRPIISRTSGDQPSVLAVDIEPTITTFHWQPLMLLASGLTQLTSLRVDHA